LTWARAIEVGLSVAEISPGKERQAKANHCGVQTLLVVIELKLVPVHQAEKDFKEQGGPPIISAGKRGAGHRSRS
jgi:hypothetical protein